MSGHSKWHSIKHKKGKEDAKRGQLFSKLSQKITIAAREGGGNPDANPSLASAIDTARGHSMPMDNIKRAIAKGTGELAGGQLEQLSFEGYGDGGVAILVEVLTDNRNRATSEVRRVFNKAGARMGEAGSVAWIFENKGVVLISKGFGHEEDRLLDIALEAGAEDLKTEGDDFWEIVTNVEHFQVVKESLAAAGIETESAELTKFPKNTVPVGRDAARKVLRLVEALEELDDVHDVYANFDIPDEVMDEMASAQGS